MLYIFVSLGYGLMTGLLSWYFRQIELRDHVINMHHQLLVQLGIFVLTAIICSLYFADVEINLGFVTLGWFAILVIYESLGFYTFQVLYEFWSGNSLFASEQEMQDYIEKIEDENSRF